MAMGTDMGTGTDMRMSSKPDYLSRQIAHDL